MRNKYILPIIFLISVPAIAQDSLVTNQQTIMYDAPHMYAKPLQTLRAGIGILPLLEEGSFLKVRYQHTTGWVRKTHVTYDTENLWFVDTSAVIPSEKAAVRSTSNVRDSSLYYILRGETIAESDYVSTAPMVGGYFSGLTFGLLGWAVGYGVTNSMDVQVPYRRMQEVPDRYQYHFEKGYTEHVKQTRAKKFNGGAAAGTVTLLLIVLTVTSG